MIAPRRFLPSVNALLAFEAVARLGSATLAAQELSLTQSAISRQLKARKRPQAMTQPRDPAAPPRTRRLPYPALWAHRTTATSLAPGIQTSTMQGTGKAP